MRHMGQILQNRPPSWILWTFFESLYLWIGVLKWDGTKPWNRGLNIVVKNICYHDLNYGLVFLIFLIWLVHFYWHTLYWFTSKWAINPNSPNWLIKPSGVAPSGMCYTKTGERPNMDDLGVCQRLTPEVRISLTENCVGRVSSIPMSLCWDCH